jgi:hypothetical protein
VEEKVRKKGSQQERMGKGRREVLKIRKGRRRRSRKKESLEP